MPPEDQFINTGIDLMPLVPRSKGLARQFLQDHVGGKYLSRIFRARSKAGRVDNAFYSSNRGIDAFVALGAIAFALLSFIGPLWILSALDDSTQRLGVITGFIVFFGLLLAAIKIEEPGQAILGIAA